MMTVVLRSGSLIGFGGLLYYQVSQNLEEAGLIKLKNILLKTELQHQLGGSNLQGWVRVIQKAVYALNQLLIYGSIFPIAKIHWFCNQGLKREWFHSLFLLQNRGKKEYICSAGDPLEASLGATLSCD